MNIQNIHITEQSEATKKKRVGREFVIFLT